MCTERGSRLRAKGSRFVALVREDALARTEQRSVVHARSADESAPPERVSVGRAWSVERSRKLAFPGAFSLEPGA